MTYEDDPLPQPIDWDELAKSEPRPPRQLMEGLPQSQPTAVFGDGGLGKSYIELTRAVCLATGRPFFGIPTRKGALTESVLYYSSTIQRPTSIFGSTTSVATSMSIWHQPVTTTC